MIVLLVNILIVLLVVGAVIYIIGLLRIDDTIKQIAYVILLLVVVIYLLQLLAGGVGIWPGRLSP